MGSTPDSINYPFITVITHAASGPLTHNLTLHLALTEVGGNIWTRAHWHELSHKAHKFFSTKHKLSEQQWEMTILIKQFFSN